MTDKQILAIVKRIHKKGFTGLTFCEEEHVIQFARAVEAHLIPKRHAVYKVKLCESCNGSGNYRNIMPCPYCSATGLTPTSIRL